MRQGIFYFKEYLLNHPYEEKYRIQADHQKNIEIVSNKRLKFSTSKEVVAYFSSGGISSTNPDLVFRNDFPRVVGEKYGWHYGVSVKIKQILIDLILGKPEKRFRIRNK